ncbi:hypothetical protein EV184_102379 [Sinorhizobium americanum]|uniref:Uncharacterized protein n=1 Tax=Sinorhizobium americanum TaxID=194963 RepID=A0A4R2C125_9HYPH|nr:hypothetical protein EV184_102379 [Sinorhizobium americanum]
MDAARLEVLDDVEQVADRTGQPIQANDDEHVAGGEILQQLRKNRPCPRCARPVLLVNPIAAGGAQLVELGVV